MQAKIRFDDAVRPLPAGEVTAPPRREVSAFSAPARRALGDLRLAGLRCRAKARADLFEACALLSVTRERAPAAHAEALVRCLGQALGRTPVLFRPGTQELSFDEAWVLRMVEAILTGDDASLTFLLRARLPMGARRLVGFLVAGLCREEEIV